MSMLKLWYAKTKMRLELMLRSVMVTNRQTVLTFRPSNVKAERRVLLRFNFLRFFIAEQITQTNTQ